MASDTKKITITDDDLDLLAEGEAATGQPWRQLFREAVARHCQADTHSSVAGNQLPPELQSAMDCAERGEFCSHEEVFQELEKRAAEIEVAATENG